MPFRSTTSIRSGLEAAGLGDDRLEATAQAFARLRHHLGVTSATDLVQWFVPGRIEVLGKHTDYAGGRSLVCAAERGFCLVAQPRSDRRLVITDLTRGSRLVANFAGQRDDVGRDEHWFLYPLAVIRRVARNFPSAVRGVDLAFESDLPSAGGLSSSSALMSALFLAIADVNDLTRSAEWTAAIHSDTDLAAYLATIENGQTFGPLAGDAGVGTAGGSEDHTAIICSEAGRLGQFAFCPVRREASVTLPSDLVFAIGGSGVAARKTGAAQGRYNRAAQAVAAILTTWQAATGRQAASLADALGQPDGLASLHAAVAASTDPEFAPVELARRLEHFLHESNRCVPEAAAQLAAGDHTAFATTVADSQAGAERLLGNQVPETVALVRAARDSGAIAASAFGAGFGGSAWALVDRAGAERFLARWAAAYRQACARPAESAIFFTTRPGPAAFRVDGPH